MRLEFKPFLLLLTIQIGCTGMPLFAHPSLPAKVSRNAPTEIHRLRRGVPQFWRQFGDPLLNRLMAEAISSTKDPAILAFRIRQARAMHRGYEPSPFPLTTNPTRIAELEPIAARRESVRSDLPQGELFDPGFDSLWEINLFSTDRLSPEIADAVYGTSAYNLRAIQVSVEGEIARDYFEFQASLGRWNVAERHAQTQARILKIAEGRQSSGKATVFETERARTQLAHTRTASLMMKAERAVALDCMAVLLGRSPSALAEELSHSGQLSVLPQQIDVGSPEQLLRRRPDIAAAERRLAGPAAKAGISVEDLLSDAIRRGAMVTPIHDFHCAYDFLAAIPPEPSKRPDSLKRPSGRTGLGKLWPDSVASSCGNRNYAHVLQPGAITMCATRSSGAGQQERRRLEHNPFQPRHRYVLGSSRRRTRPVRSRKSSR